MIEFLFGSTRVVSTFKVDGSKVYLGGYRIDLDQTGQEVSRIENTWNLVMRDVPDYCLPIFVGERIL